MDDRISELSAEGIIRIGGWHPSYARVLLIECDGDFGVVLVDGNGDGAELELEYWQRDADGRWSGGSSSGHGGLDYMPSAQSWNAGPFVAAMGRAEPGAEITLEYGGRRFSRRATEWGTWGFVHLADSATFDERPSVIAVTPPSR